MRSRSGLREFRRHVQLVLQDPYGALNPRQNVYDAVAEGLRLHGQRQGLTRRVAEALEQVGMRPPEHFFDRYPHQLSGGQQQRVVIAGALTLGPDVLVADEPVSSLDASVRGEILKLFLRTARRARARPLSWSATTSAWPGTSPTGLRSCTSAGSWRSGRVEEVLLRPQHPYTRALLEAVPSTSGRDPERPAARRAARPDGDPAGLPLPPALPAARRCCPRTRPAQCLADVPVLPPGEDTRQVACFHVDEWQSVRRSTTATRPR